MNQYHREYRLQKKFGLSPEEYDEMFEEQNGACAICLNRTVQNLCVDHDHKTGKIRKLLCTNCNVGLGNFKDNRRLLAQAIVYLEDHA